MNKDKQLTEFETEQTVVDSDNSNSIHSTRVFIFALCALLILAMPIIAYKAVHDWRKLKTLQAELTTVQKQSSDLTILKQRLKTYKSYHNNLKQLMSDAKQSQLGPNYWIERKVQINKKQINRGEASGFLQGTGHDENSFFKTSMFAINTIKIGDDLFKFRQGDSNEVQMTMDGVFYTKIKGQNNATYTSNN